MCIYKWEINFKPVSSHFTKTYTLPLCTVYPRYTTHTLCLMTNVLQILYVGDKNRCTYLAYIKHNLFGGIFHRKVVNTTIRSHNIFYIYTSVCSYRVSYDKLCLIRISCDGILKCFGFHSIFHAAYTLYRIVGATQGNYRIVSKSFIEIVAT